MDDGLLTTDKSLFDYGCGHGDDVKELTARGFSCDGWDPRFRPNVERVAADIVNLGFVLNVIEDHEERCAALRAAWSLTCRVLIVSARLSSECVGMNVDRFADGVLTRRNTFQKFFNQEELRSFIDTVLKTRAVAATTGVFYVFREISDREAFLAARVQRPPWATITLEALTTAYNEAREDFEPLVDFLRRRGRLPSLGEVSSSENLVRRFGSLAKAANVLKRMMSTLDLAQAREDRTEDLLIYLALSAFEQRPPLSKLPLELQLDIRAMFRSYQRACALADAVLLEAGHAESIDRACRRSKIGKVTPTALYVHVDARLELDPLLRIYEGCARAIVGVVAGANVIKLHRDRPQISYLQYPDFERAPHPVLSSSLLVSLQTFELSWRDYSDTKNPPVLHRKEELVSRAHPSRLKFEKLTKAEEEAGLFGDVSRIGTLLGWQDALSRGGVRLVGHRLVRAVRA